MTIPENPSSHGTDGQPNSFPWDSRLQAHGLSTGISSEFLSRIPKIADEKPDRLTGLPIETDAMRRSIITRLGTALRSNESFACIYADTDNLKAANNISRQFGDSVIRYDAAQTMSLVEDIDPETTSVFAVRQTHAADETVLWIFGLNNEQLAQLRARTASFTKKRIAYSIDDSTNFTLSTSAAIVDSTSVHFADQIHSTKRFLDDGEDSLPFDLYEEFKEYADDQTKLLKTINDLEQFPVEGVAQAELTPDAIEDFLVESMGGRRISKPLLRTALRISRKSELLELLNGRYPREMIASEMNIPEENLAGFTYADLRVIYFDFILHDTYAKAGFTRH